MVYLTYHILKINIINVLNIVQISICSVTRINNNQPTYNQKETS